MVKRKSSSSLLLVNSNNNNNNSNISNSNSNGNNSDKMVNKKILNDEIDDDDNNNDKDYNSNIMSNKDDKDIGYKDNNNNKSKNNFLDGDKIKNKKKDLNMMMTTKKMNIKDNKNDNDTNTTNDKNSINQDTKIGKVNKNSENSESGENGEKMKFINKNKDDDNEEEEDGDDDAENNESSDDKSNEGESSLISNNSSSIFSPGNDNQTNGNNNQSLPEKQRLEATTIILNKSHELKPKPGTCLIIPFDSEVKGINLYELNKDFQIEKQNLGSKGKNKRTHNKSKKNGQMKSSKLYLVVPVISCSNTYSPRYSGYTDLDLSMPPMVIKPGNVYLLSRAKVEHGAKIDPNYKYLTYPNELRAKGKRRGNVTFSESKLLCSKTDLNMIPTCNIDDDNDDDDENRTSKSEIALTLHQFFSQDESLRQYDILYCINRKSRTGSASFTPFGSSDSISFSSNLTDEIPENKTRNKRKLDEDNKSIEDNQIDEIKPSPETINQIEKPEAPISRPVGRPSKRRKNEQTIQHQIDQEQTQVRIADPETQAYAHFCISLVQDGKVFELEKELEGEKKEIAIQALVQFKNRNWRDYGVCYIAIEQDDYSMLDLLLRYIPGLVIITDKFGGTPLHYACEKDDEISCEIIFRGIGVLAARFNNSPDSQLYALRLAIDLLTRRNNANWMPIHNSLKNLSSKTAKLMKEKMIQLVAPLATINIHELQTLCLSWFNPAIPNTFQEFYENEYQEAKLFLQQFKNEISNAISNI